MVALRQIGTLPVKDFAARIDHDAVFGWMELESLADHKKESPVNCEFRKGKSNGVFRVGETPNTSVARRGKHPCE